MCPTVENPVLVYQTAGNPQGTSHPRPAERDSRQAIQTWPDHSNRVVTSSRSVPSYMLLVASASSGPICHQVQQQTSAVCVMVPDPQAWAVDALSLSWEDLDPYAFPPAAILGKVVEKLQDYSCNRIILIAPGWPNMPWFWDLVAMSNQIPLCLPNIPNLLSQPFNQVLHRNLSNLNLHAWLLEPQQSRSRARKWCLSNQVDFRAPPLKAIADFFRTRSCNQALLMATDQPLLTNWAIPPLMSARMRISLVSWTVSIEADPRAGGAPPPGTFPWCYTS